jgi:Tol biopolymer transport system component
VSFWTELRRRNVFKVGALYAIVGWLIAQIASVFTPALSLPDWVTPLVVFVLILGFPVALILAWAYELTPRGIKRTQRLPLAESLRRVTGQQFNYVVTGLLVLAVSLLVVDNYVLDRAPRQARVDADDRAGSSATQDSASESQTIRLSISAEGRVTPQMSAAISPDGRQVAFVATDAAGTAKLWVRSLDQLEARALAGTERAAHPFWSPDGRSLGFIADGRVKRVEAGGGPVRTVAETATRFGAAWGSDGTVLFVPQLGVLAAVPASGGAVTTILTADPLGQITSFGWPAFLPDGRHFLVFGMSTMAEHRGVYAGSLDSTTTKLILPNDLRAMYAEPGYLVYPVDDTLLAQPFDPARLELSAEPTPIAAGIWFARGAAQSGFSVSTSGDLAYVNISLWDAELAWFDREGRPLGSPSGTVRYEGVTPQISPDSQRVAVARGELLREDIWTLDASTGAATPLTSGPNSERSPVWAADGHRLMYFSEDESDTRLGRQSQIVVHDIETSTQTLVLDDAPGPITDWSRDGRFVVLSRITQSADILVMRLDGEDQPPFVFESTPFNQTQAQLSPDGQWIAYTSNETGRDEVYLQAFPTPGRKRQVSTSGGAMPRWRADGRELFYVATNQFLTAVPVTNDATLELGIPLPLFRTRLVVQGSESLGLATTYDVAPDGERFLLRHPPVDPGPPITVVLNWASELAADR